MVREMEGGREREVLSNLMERGGREISQKWRVEGGMGAT